DRARPRAAVRGAREARPPRPRRQGPRLVERAHARRLRGGRRGARPRRLPRRRGPQRGVPHPADGPRRAAASILEGRPRNLFDNAVPSGTSVAIDWLLRLAVITGEERYETTALKALRPMADLMQRYPSGFGRYLSALDFHLGPVAG